MPSGVDFMILGASFGACYLGKCSSLCCSNPLGETKDFGTIQI